MTSRAPVRAWFTPGLIGLHVFWLAAVIVCTLGGFWQFGSYENRQGAAADDARRDGVVDITQLWSAGDPMTTDLQNRTVTVNGEFADSADQIWVTGAATRGDVWLVAPFQVAGSDAALMVVRGKQSAVSAQLPAVPAGLTKLTVVLQPSLGGAEPLDDRRVTSSITVASLLNELPFQLWSGYGVITDGAAPQTGGQLVDPPDPDVSWTVGLKNLAYALQWWVFAAFSVFMWWRMISEQVADAQESASVEA